jgi:hypothetical protein
MPVDENITTLNSNPKTKWTKQKRQSKKKAQ